MHLITQGFYTCVYSSALLRFGLYVVQGMPEFVLVPINQGCFLAFFSKLKDQNFKTQAIFWPKLKDFFLKTQGFLSKLNFSENQNSINSCKFYNIGFYYIYNVIFHNLSLDDTKYELKLIYFCNFQWENSNNRHLKPQAIFINSTELKNSTIFYPKLKDFCSTLNISETK